MSEVSTFRLYLLRAMYLWGYVFKHYVKAPGNPWGKQVTLSTQASVAGVAAPTNRSPANCGPSARPFRKPIAAGGTANFQLNSGSL
jgi:hypothetical protein